MMTTVLLMRHAILRVYAWKGLLDEGGWVAIALSKLGIDHLLLALGELPQPVSNRAEYLRLARVHGARVEVFAALESCGHHFAFGLGPLMDP